MAIGAAFAVLAFLVGGQYLARHFPFRRDVLLTQLHAHAEAKIEIGQFTDAWLTPGFSARKIRLSDRDGEDFGSESSDAEGDRTFLAQNRFDEIDSVHHLRPWIECLSPASASRQMKSRRRDVHARRA